MVPQKIYENIGKQFKKWAFFYFMQNITKAGKNGAYSTKTIASGNTFKSITYETQLNGVTVEADKKWYYSNYGRGSGRVPSIAPFLRWIKDKKLSKGDEKKDRAFAFAIRASIAKKGTNKPPSSWYEKTVARTDFYVDRTAIPQLQEYYGREVEKVIQNFEKTSKII